jgi:hypothetical protein
MRVFASAETTSICILVLAAALCGAGQTAAQQPSEDQIAAVKSNCRSDFMAKCWGVPRGGTEAFQCLKKNLASLSAPCQQAVQAAIAAATPKAPSAAPAPAKQEGAPAAPAQPSATAAPCYGCGPIFAASAQARHRSCDAAERASARSSIGA